MAKSVRSKKQAQSEKRALRKLISTGIYRGKVDLRKRPTKYQKSLISKYSDVLKGKAVVVEPDRPESYGEVFKRVGKKKVVVPRRKGEKIKVIEGEIYTVRKVGKRTVKSKFKHVPKGERPARPKKNVQYAIQLAAPGGELVWKRFPSYDELAKFLEGYNYKGWPNYVVEEEIGDEEDDELLWEKLEARLGPQNRHPSFKRNRRNRKRRR